MAGYVVVLDANVLYGIEVTDFFATMATRRLFRPHWSPQILDEVARNLALRPELDAAAVARRVEHLNRALPGALTDVPDSLISSMPVNDNDRHVLALAVLTAARPRSRRNCLEEAGCEVVEDQPLPGYDRVYVSDPFGNRIELMEPND